MIERVTALWAAMAMLVGAPAAHASLTEGPYLQNVDAGSATLVFRLDAAAAAQVSLFDTAGATVATASVAPAAVHEVALGGLSPGTRYTWRVEVDGLPPEVGEVSTAPALGSTEPFTFLVYGDTRGNDAIHRAVVEAMAGEAPDFLVALGDLVVTGGTAAYWTTFFDIERDLLRMHPMWPVLGNHDLSNGGLDLYRERFAVPLDGPEPERAYTFRWGNAACIVLDGNVASDLGQLFWLAAQLRQANTDPTVGQIFVFVHQPPYSAGLHGGTTAMKEDWAPLFRDERVTAVFAGHDHLYQRLVADGVTYFVSGGGGAPLYAVRDTAADADFLALGESMYHYLRIRVSGANVSITAVRNDGTVIEETQLSRAPAPPVEPPVDPPPDDGASGCDLTRRHRNPAGLLASLLALFAITPLTRRVGAAKTYRSCAARCPRSSAAGSRPTRDAAGAASAP